MDPNQMWEVIDLVIRENVKENEAIKSCGCDTVQLTYSMILNNSLYQCGRMLCKKTCQQMTVPTLRVFMKEVIGSMRSEVV